MYKIFQTLTPILLTALLYLFGTPSLAAGKPVRFASWNIADFHHGIGVEAREKIGTRRYAADFDVLKQYATALDADVIALQEIVTEAAARLLFPADRYWLYMSSRYSGDKAAGAEPDIYTALAIRKGAGIKPVRQLDLDALQIEPEGENPYDRSTRKGTAVLLEIGDDAVWVMSVHLKSSCANIKNPHRSRQRACKMLWQQALYLQQWIIEKQTRQESFIIAGDFNRRFGRLKNQGSIWKLFSTLPVENTAVMRYPDTSLRRCPTRKGKGVHPIDWFLLNAKLGSAYIQDSYHETRWSRAESRRHRKRLSDHCPIQIDIMFGDLSP